MSFPPPRPACPAGDGQCRDLERALELRQGQFGGQHPKACELTSWRNHDYVSTLAIAYSEAGDFAAAIKRQNEAIGLLPSLPEDNRAAWQSNYEARLKLYQSGKAYSKNFLAEKTVAWYEFDEAKDGSVIDSSGNNLHGKLIGDAKIISDPERGNVLCLDGDGDYVDGRLDNSADASGLPETPDEFPALIGENAEERGHYWNGLIDDARLYSYALSEAEIKALYEPNQPPRKKEGSSE